LRLALFPLEHRHARPQSALEILEGGSALLWDTGHSFDAGSLEEKDNVLNPSHPPANDTQLQHSPTAGTLIRSRLAGQIFSGSIQALFRLYRFRRQHSSFPSSSPLLLTYADVSSRILTYPDVCAGSDGNVVRVRTVRVSSSNT